jgi:hypothetical protein
MPWVIPPNNCLLRYSVAVRSSRKRHLVEHIKEEKLKLEVSLRKTPEGVPALYVANPAAK